MPVALCSISCRTNRILTGALEEEKQKMALEEESNVQLEHERGDGRRVRLSQNTPTLQNVRALYRRVRLQPARLFAPIYCTCRAVYSRDGMHQ